MSVRGMAFGYVLLEQIEEVWILLVDIAAHYNNNEQRKLKMETSDGRE
jgi:hypothetical protein